MGNAHVGRVTPKEHDHAGHMVFALDADRVCRHCWCAECGQEWVLEVAEQLVLGAMKSVVKGWRPVPA